MVSADKARDRLHGHVSADDISAKDDDDFIIKPDPDHPGWLSWSLKATNRFNTVIGPLWAKRVTACDSHKVIVRSYPGPLQGNIANNVHGGAILTQVDIALFICGRLSGALRDGPGVTLDLNTHFYGAGQIGRALDCEVEILRETGRLLFLRGLVVQGDLSIGSFSGTIRKLRGDSPAAAKAG